MNNKVLSLYDWFLIVGVIASNILYSVLSGNVDIIGSVAGIAGVLCVVLVAKGNIWNYCERFHVCLHILQGVFIWRCGFECPILCSYAIHRLVAVEKEGSCNERKGVRRAGRPGEGTPLYRTSAHFACARKCCCCSCRRIYSQAFWRSSTFQGLGYNSPEYNCSGSHGSCIHGTMGALDNNQCHQCSHVVNLCCKR